MSGKLQCITFWVFGLLPDEAAVTAFYFLNLVSMQCLHDVDTSY